MRLRSRPIGLWILLAVLAQLSLRALLGGGALLLVPSGDIVGLSPGMLDATPFANFLVPGLVLTVVFGLFPAFVCYGLYTRQWWGWIGAAAIAIALLGWLSVEVALGFDRPTIYLNLTTAGAILVLATRPSVRHEGQGTATYRSR